MKKQIIKNAVGKAISWLKNMLKAHNNVRKGTGRRIIPRAFIAPNKKSGKRVLNADEVVWPKQPSNPAPEPEPEPEPDPEHHEQERGPGPPGTPYGWHVVGGDGRLHHPDNWPPKKYAKGSKRRW